jgi:large subunit ribosomal protein L32
MHIYMEERKTIACKKCGKPVLAHTVCSSCGFYKGREVINVLEKLTKKERKKKEKEMKEKEQAEKPLSMEELSKK